MHGAMIVLAVDSSTRLIINRKSVRVCTLLPILHFEALTLPYPEDGQRQKPHAYMQCWLPPGFSRNRMGAWKCISTCVCRCLVLTGFWNCQISKCQEQAPCKRFLTNMSATSPCLLKYGCRTTPPSSFSLRLLHLNYCKCHLFGKKTKTVVRLQRW